MTLNSNNQKKSSDSKLKDIFKGMLALGGGKEEGINLFPSSTDGVLSALAPWIALLVVIDGFNILSVVQAKKAYLYIFTISLFLYKLCTVLLIPILIHSFSVLWHKERFWKRTVSSYCWCQWMPILDLIIGMMIVSLPGFTPSIILGFMAVLMILYLAYMIWISWMTIKVGLQINNKQSLIVVISLFFSEVILLFILSICNSDTLVRLSHELSAVH